MKKTDLTPSPQPLLFRGEPALVAHRGYAQHYPENTLLALEAAINAGAKFIEFDIQLSKDGVPFLIHDDNLLRTAGVDLSVFQANMSQLEEVSVGEPQRFGDRFLSATPIRLKELSDRLSQWPDVHAFIEIKQQSVERFGREKVVNEVLGATESLVNEHVVISFNAEIVKRIQCVSNRRAGWVIPLWNQSNLELLQGLSPDFVFCNYKKTPKGVKLPDLGPSWVLYEIDSIESLTYSRSVGADLIETMAVETMLEKLTQGDRK